MVFVDQVSFVVPLLRRLTTAKVCRAHQLDCARSAGPPEPPPGAPVQVLFYCHFPDFLLARPAGWLHRLYRSVLDNLEEATTGAAHLVLVNSRFTQGACPRLTQDSCTAPAA